MSEPPGQEQVLARLRATERRAWVGSLGAGVSLLVATVALSFTFIDVEALALLASLGGALFLWLIFGSWTEHEQNQARLAAGRELAAAGHADAAAQLLKPLRKPGFFVMRKALRDEVGYLIAQAYDRAGAHKLACRRPR